jgi:hypothetical protein
MALPTLVGQRSGLFYTKQRGALTATLVDTHVFTGNVFFVMTGGTDTAGHGLTPDDPFATVDFAIGQCTANQGDTIFVMPGYTETLTNSARWTCDVAGISIRGLGFGTAKPTLTFGTDTTADILISAANTVISNFRMVCDINDLVNFLDINVGNVLIEDCDFVTSSAKEALGFINLATTFDDLTIRRCTALQPTDPAGSDGAVDTGFLFFIDSENILVEDCEFYGNFETAIIHNRTTAGKNVWVVNCRGVQLLSGAEPFQLVDGCEGGMVAGGFNTPAEAAVTEATLVGTIGDKFFIHAGGTFGNDGAAGGQGGIIPATSS